MKQFKCLTPPFYYSYLRQQHYQAELHDIACILDMNYEIVKEEFNTWVSTQPISTRMGLHLCKEYALGWNKPIWEIDNG